MSAEMYPIHAETTAHAVAVIRGIVKGNANPSLVGLGLQCLDALADRLGIDGEQERQARLDIVAQLEEAG